jgi:GNAT superfamily N-acetyltransferase
MDIALATRPVRPTDRTQFRRLWPRLSPDTVYRRFHAPLHGLPPETVERLVTVDHDLREAVVGLVGGDVVGVARYDRSPDDPTTAEFAILVEDAWQGVGLGRQLLVELIDLAASRGVRTLTATVQRDNDRVIALIRRLLPQSTFTPEDDVFGVVSLLPRAPAPPAASTSTHRNRKDMS